MRPGLRALYDRDLRLCWICGLFVSETAASRDHVVPRSHGGTRAPSNLRLAHKLCNSRRGNGPPIARPLQNDRRRCRTCKNERRHCTCKRGERPVLDHITNANARDYWKRPPQSFDEKLAAQKQDEERLAAELAKRR